MDTFKRSNCSSKFQKNDRKLIQRNLSISSIEIFERFLCDKYFDSKSVEILWKNIQISKSDETCRLKKKLEKAKNSSQLNKSQIPNNFQKQSMTHSMNSSPYSSFFVNFQTNFWSAKMYEKVSCFIASSWRHALLLGICYFSRRTFQNLRSALKMNLTINQVSNQKSGIRRNSKISKQRWPSS